MTEKLKICLVGPRGAGKSSLLAALGDCVMQNAFGYSPQLRPTLQPISRIEYDDGAASASRFELLENLVSDYERLRREFADGGVATAPTDVFDYYFRLIVNGEAVAENRGKAPVLIEIADASGELAAPSPAGKQISFALKEKFAAKLLNADAIVLVLPLVRFEECAWTADIARLLERLAQAGERRAKRFVIAFSQYERLFTQLGPSAFTYACDPAVALHVVRKAAQSAPWLDALRRFESAEPNTKTRFTVVSAFGFCKNFQNPNLDPHQAEERRFRRAGGEGAQAFNEFWRPFLVAEPFLFAALDLDSAFTFSSAQVDGAQPLLVA